MAKAKPVPRKPQPIEPDLFAGYGRRRRRKLFLPRILATEAESNFLKGDRRDKAFEIINELVEMETKGHLAKKETALDAGFLQRLFTDALSYRSVLQTQADYHLERNFAVPGVGTADGALGQFGTDKPPAPVAMIELKDAGTDLDRDKFNGRTPVQQCWDYLNATPDCPWGIVSNFVTIRLYHRDKTPLAFQEFNLQDLCNPPTFRQFWCVFEFGGLLWPHPTKEPRTLKMLHLTANRQREVGDKLYEEYSHNRAALINHLQTQHGKSLDLAIHIGQKILDRIIFIAFCEDRDLLPAKCIDRTFNDVGFLPKVVNPRWQNFLALFQSIDRGNKPVLDLEHGYNGGLFKHDPDVDDLQLDDTWTKFFHTIGGYDFRDEINVDVLGHLFEKSVGELEKMRLGGLFVGNGNGNGDGKINGKIKGNGNGWGNGNGGMEPTMPKSAERKRFGIYYTPPEFTQFLVMQAIRPVLDERLAQVRNQTGIAKKDLESDKPSAKASAFWRACLDALQQVKVCDPACGSGAFLIEAFDLFEEYYRTIVNNLIFHEGPSAEALLDAIPDSILTHNLHGVDLSEQGVEITQLALWLRSAKRGKTLADLSKNIVWGNSLVTDLAVHPKGMIWKEAFPTIFNRPNPGFDAVVGNPPWERMKLQEREFFAFAAPKIAGAVNAAQRQKMVEDLKIGNPDLHARYLKALEAADKTSAHVRASGEFPQTAKGDINTYMLFAELARKIVAARGRVGLLVPSGIATDNTTREFFADLMDSHSLVGLYDFENRLRVFPDVDRRFKFCALIVGGSKTKADQADFVFFAHQMEDLEDNQRHIKLSIKDLALLNPNTRTCPIFRSRRDAELTKSVYRRVPVLVHKKRKQGGNPWGIKFVRMFDQTNDAALFRPPAELQAGGFHLQGNCWIKKKQVYLPLYEAKMIQVYDHRAASVVIEEGNWVRQGQTEETTLVDHQNPEFAPLPRWWVDAKEIPEVAQARNKLWFLGFKDITSPTNQRTMIAAAIPWSAVTNHFPIMLTGATPRLELCLLANLNSFALDYLARQKIGGVTLNFFIVEQFPIVPPDQYAERCPWNKKQTLEKWISDRVLKLTCTADDMKPLAEAAGFDPPVHKWKAAEREELMAELDAAFFHLYGIGRDDVEYMLGTFQCLRDDESRQLFTHDASPAQRILAAYDRLGNDYLRAVPYDH